MADVIKFTGLYMAANALILLVLAVYVMRLRWRYETSLMDGGHPHLVRAIRAHGNAAENIPVVLLLLLFVGVMGANMTILHVMGLSLTVGRLAHPIGILKGSLMARAIGMTGTWGAMALGIFMLVYLALR